MWALDDRFNCGLSIGSYFESVIHPRLNDSVGQAQDPVESPRCLNYQIRLNGQPLIIYYEVIVLDEGSHTYYHSRTGVDLHIGNLKPFKKPT